MVSADQTTRHMPTHDAQNMNRGTRRSRVQAPQEQIACTNLNHSRPIEPLPHTFNTHHHQLFPPPLEIYFSGGVASTMPSKKLTLLLLVCLLQRHPLRSMLLTESASLLHHRNKSPHSRNRRTQPSSTVSRQMKLMLRWIT